MPDDPRSRCPWPGNDPQMAAYHDLEWGVVERDGRALYEKLCLDGFQAGLSWRTILHKRDGFRRAFDGFDPERVARWDDARMAVALADPGIVRNRAKVAAAVTNARAYLDLRDRGVDFAVFLLGLAGGKRIVNAWTDVGQVPAATAGSVAMSKGLAKAGFRFCGPTVCYAYMQAIGIVNDHLVDCFRYREV